MSEGTVFSEFIGISVCISKNPRYIDGDVLSGEPAAFGVMSAGFSFSGETDLSDESDGLDRSDGSDLTDEFQPILSRQALQAKCVPYKVDFSIQR